jgi:predicted DNA-binding transcriptional regulator AlpA
MSPRNAKKPRKPPIELPLDDDAFIRLPVVLAVYPVGETSWWKAVKTGLNPKPVKLSPRVNGWKVVAIRRLLASRLDEDHP